MYYFFFGENYYLIKKKVSAIKNKFLLSDPSSLNISEFSGDDLDPGKFWSAVLALPFLAKKRLIIVKNLLLENKDDDFKKDLAKKLNKIPLTSLVFFVEDGTPDKRSALFKALNKTKISQNFTASSVDLISNIVAEALQETGIAISDEARKKFLLYVGVDSFRAENEISKLVLFAKNQKLVEINSDLVEDMVRPANSAGIFEFIDAIGGKNKENASILLTKLLESGENELYILTMIIYQYRNMLIVQDYLKRGIHPSQIAKMAKIHPFVVQKITSILKKHQEALLIAHYLDLGEYDSAIKTGRLDIKVALLMIISKFCY